MGPRSPEGRAPLILLAIAMAVSGTLLIVLGSRLTFGYDDVLLLVQRLGNDAGTFLEPHNRHPVMGVMAEYRLLQETVGMDSVTPFQVVSVLAFLASVGALFAYTRRLVGDWLALAGAIAVLFLGSAAEDLLDPLQICFFAPMAGGITALMALERERRGWDVAATALLVFGLLFSGLGLAFLAGAAISIVLGPRPFTKRLYVVAVPLALFLLWTLAYQDGNPLLLEDFVTAPAYTMDGFASSLAGLLGLATTRNDADVGALDWGRTLLLIVGAATTYYVVRQGRATRGFWVVLGTALFFWMSTAANASSGFYAADSSRYRYMGAVFILLIAAEVLRGVRLSTRSLLWVYGALAIAVASNLVALRDEYHSRHDPVPQIKGAYAALDIARGIVPPDFELTEENSGVPVYFVGAGEYLAAAQQYGSFGYSVDELRGAAPSGRATADRVLVAALGIELTPVDEPASGACERVELQDGSPSVVPQPASTLTLSAGDRSTASVSLERFSEGSPVPVGGLEAGEDAELELAPDGAEDPWRILLAGAGEVEVCSGA